MFDADRVVFARVYQDGPIKGMIDVSHVEKDIEELLQSNENMPAMLCITSRGGLLSEAFGFYERLMIFGGERRRRLDTIALEEVSSAALIIYLMGNKRFVTPHVRLFVHQLSGYYGDNYASIVAHCSEGKLSKSEILNMMTKEGTSISSDQAIRMGLAHEIVDVETEEMLMRLRTERRVGGFR